MTTFRAELIVSDYVVDDMEFETDSKEMALKYAVQRFENAYPFFKNVATIKVIEIK